MNKLYNYIVDTLNKAIKLSLTFLCLGVVIQLLIDDDLLNWDPIGNIQDAGPIVYWCNCSCCFISFI